LLKAGSALSPLAAILSKLMLFHLVWQTLIFETFFLMFVRLAEPLVGRIRART